MYIHRITLVWISLVLMWACDDHAPPVSSNMMMDTNPSNMSDPPSNQGGETADLDVQMNDMRTSFLGLIGKGSELANRAIGHGLALCRNIRHGLNL